MVMKWRKTIDQTLNPGHSSKKGNPKKEHSRKQNQTIQIHKETLKDSYLLPHGTRVPWIWGKPYQPLENQGCFHSYPTNKIPFSNKFLKKSQDPFLNKVPWNPHIYITTGIYKIASKNWVLNRLTGRQRQVEGSCQRVETPPKKAKGLSPCSVITALRRFSLNSFLALIELELKTAREDSGKPLLLHRTRADSII